MPKLLYTPEDNEPHDRSKLKVRFPDELYAQGQCHSGEYVKFIVPVPGSLSSKISICAPNCNLCPILSDVVPSYVDHNTHTDCSYDLRDLRDIDKFILENPDESKKMCSSLSLFSSDSPEGAYCRSLPDTLSDEIKRNVCEESNESSESSYPCSWINRARDPLYHDAKTLVPGENDSCWWKKQSGALLLSSHSPCVAQSSNISNVIDELTPIYSLEEIESKLILRDESKPETSSLTIPLVILFLFLIVILFLVSLFLNV